MNVVAIVQARMRSTRLPGKVLAEICGKPLLQHMVERLERCKTLDSIIVAIAEGKENEQIVEVVAETILTKEFGESRLGWSWGSEKDVLARVLNAARLVKADVVVELTADCPLIDPEVVDLAVERYFQFTKALTVDMVSTSRDSFFHDPSEGYPRGMDVRVFSIEALEDMDKLAGDDLVYREHVSLIAWAYPRKRFWVANLKAPRELRSDARLTVDEPADLKLIQAIFEHFAPRNDFSLEEILGLLEKKPELRQINAHVQQKAAR